jgi:hypothetical protein
MPTQDAQGRWISDDGRSYWDGGAWKPLEAQPAGAQQPPPPAPAYQPPPAPAYGQPPAAPTYQQPPAPAYQPPSYAPPQQQQTYANPAGPGYPQQPPTYAPAGFQPVPKRRSGMAIWSLVLGIASLVFWLLPILGFPVAIAGLITGVLARSGSRRGMALAGMICSIIGFALSLINAAVGVYLAVNKPAGAMIANLFFGANLFAR